MQAAESIARSETSFGIRIAFPSGAPPQFAETYPPAAMMRSNALRSTTRSLTTGNARAPRLDGNRVSLVESAHVKLADRRATVRPMWYTVDNQAAHPANAFPAV